MSIRISGRSKSVTKGPDLFQEGTVWLMNIWTERHILNNRKVKNRLGPADRKY
jgi:hypothetical protein